MELIAGADARLFKRVTKQTDTRRLLRSDWPVWARRGPPTAVPVTIQPFSSSVRRARSSLIDGAAHRARLNRPVAAPLLRRGQWQNQPAGSAQVTRPTHPRLLFKVGHDLTRRLGHTMSRAVDGLNVKLRVLKVKGESEVDRHHLFVTWNTELIHRFNQQKHEAEVSSGSVCRLLRYAPHCWKMSSN